jgi:hypothetical protein
VNAPDQSTSAPRVAAVPRAIEVGFPIVEINRLAEPERNSFKPIYEMHKWFARRASCVSRDSARGAEAVGPAGRNAGLMAEFYKNHADDPDTQGKVVLDPFMGGGTTVVEALRLGCKPIGIDLNPVAWFIIKTEIEPVDIGALKAAFERLAARPVAWNGGKPLRETLLGLYKTEAAPGVEAGVIYTFWVKHAICTDPTCKKDVPLFKCLELYSAHYDKVLDHEGRTLPLHRALQDISAIVDQLVTRDRPLPAELENIDSLSYVWLRCLMPRRTEVSVDTLSKDLRSLRVSADDVKNAGLVIKGRSGRGRTYEVKQPGQRLESALGSLESVAAAQAQVKLFGDNGAPENLLFADLWQALIALSDAGESVLPLLEKFRAQWPEIAAGLKYCRRVRSDWETAIDRVIAVMEGAPLLAQHGPV